MTGEICVDLCLVPGTALSATLLLLSHSCADACARHSVATVCSDAAVGSEKGAWMVVGATTGGRFG